KVDPNMISLGEYRFDKRNTELVLGNQRTELTGKEADLLLLLYKAANTSVAREVILNKVWGDQGDYVGRTLDVFISKLRKKFEADPKVKIVNIRGVGYKLVIGV
ncbi:MAG: winged helix-turn-helix domain-containing protein, partial [Bacteroidota bacterium]